METLLGALLSYLISIAAGLRTGAISEKRKKKLQEKLKKEAPALQAIQDRMSLMEQMRLVGTEAARIKAKAGITKVEQPLFDLLTDEVFQDHLAQWLMAWKPEEKKKAEDVLSKPMAKALKKGGADDKQIKAFKKEYFDQVEKVVFKEPVLANWRLNLALNALLERLDELEAQIRREGKETRTEVREQHQETRLMVPEVVTEMVRQQTKQFSIQQKQQAVDRYRDLADRPECR